MVVISAVLIALTGLLGLSHPRQATPERIEAVRVVATLAPTPTPTPVPTATPVRVSTTPAPIATPKPSPKPLPAAPGSVRAQVLAAWPGDDQWADRTVSCETGGTWDPRATGGTGDAYWGLWQMGPWARNATGGADPRTQSPAEQTRRAWQLIKMENSGQWSCSPYWYDP